MDVDDTVLPPHCDISLDISDEQAEFLDAISRGECIRGEALPGCGKSKLIEEVFKAFPERNIIALSYNSKLVRISNERLRRRFAEINREDTPICLKTFHSLLSSLIKQNIHNDLLFSEALRCMNFSLLAETWAYFDFDLLIIDEAQDLRLPYVRFIIKLILQVCRNKEKLQLMFLGDPMQELYGFYPINKADSRFLSLAEEIFGVLLPNRVWYHAQLSVSYRVTPQVANFVNALVPSRTMISGKAHKSKITNWVTLYILDVYRDAAQVVYDIIKKEGFKKRGKIMILCSSLNENSPVKPIVDLLVANGVSVHVKRSGALADGARLDTLTIENCNCGDDMLNKVCCDTCCGSKGLEQDIDIFLNMCELLTPGLLTNQQYVALTRPRKRLYILQHAFYTSQTQVDALINNPNICQRDLRIIQMRPIVAQLKPKENRITKKETFYSKNALAVKTLFAFLDVEHLEDLVQYVENYTVIPGLNESKLDEEEPTEEKYDDEETYNTPCANYIADMTLSFDSDVTHVNVTNICSMALQLMLEFAFTQRTPIFISQILQKIGCDVDPKYTTMRNTIHDAIDILESNEARKNINNFGIGAFVIANASQFGKIAVVHDAFYGFRENLYAITNYDFCQHPQIETRFYILFESIEKIMSEHDLNSKDFIWHKEKTGRFVHEGEPVQIKACPAIQCNNVVVTFTNNTATSHDDRFCAIVSAIIVSNNDENLENTELYVMNVFDASTQKVCLLCQSLPQQEDESDATTQQHETTLLKRLREDDNDSDDTHHTQAKKPKFCEEEAENNVSNTPSKTPKITDYILLQRREPCPFLKSAISFKTWQQDEDDNNSSNNKEANDEFILRIHAEIANIQNQSVVKPQPQNKNDQWQKAARKNNSSSHYESCE